jgi:hypothetical protein
VHREVKGRDAGNESHNSFIDYAAKPPVKLKRMPALDKAKCCDEYVIEHLVKGDKPNWTGTIVGSQAEHDAAIERLRNDGAPGHWLAVAPRDWVIVDHSVIDWLLITAPLLPAQADVEWVMKLHSSAHKARCPVWMFESLIGIPNPQCAGMLLPRETPGYWPGETKRLHARIKELEAENAELRSEIENIRAPQASAGA